MLVKLFSSHFSIYGVMCGEETHKETEHEEHTFCSLKLSCKLHERSRDTGVVLELSQHCRCCQIRSLLDAL